MNAITNSAEKVGPSVVCVWTSRTIVRRYIPFGDDFFQFFFGDMFFSPYEERQKVQGLGSGILFSPQGYIVTNQHVIEGAEEIRISISDGRDFEGKLIGSDKFHDVAIIKINGSNLPYSDINWDGKLYIGEWVIAIGNPFGYRMEGSTPSVTVGVISGIGRNFRESIGESEGRIYRDMIQTDAAINPGNSGGPLVIATGDIVGMNTFIFTESGGSLGVGFAIPIQNVRKVANELIKYGKYRPIWLGLRGQNITPKIAKALNIDIDYGILIREIDKRSPAEKAGIKVGDVIISINNKKVSDLNDAKIIFYDFKVDDIITIGLIRKNKKFSVKIKLEELPEELY